MYKIRNLLNGKVYIGQSTDIVKRFKDHKRSINYRIKHPLYNSFNKYGINNFEFNVIEHIENITDLDQREQYWMDHYKSYNKDYGYNLSPTAGGSNIGCKASQETRDKMSLSRKGKKRDLFSDEWKQKISLVSKKRWENPEYRRNFIKKQKGKVPWNKGLKMSDEFKQNCSKRQKELWKDPIYAEKLASVKLGKKQSKETIQKRRNSLMGRKFSEETKQKIAKSHIGKKHSVETIFKLKEAWKVRKLKRAS